MGCHTLLQGIFPTQGSKVCLESPMDGGAWWATLYGVTKPANEGMWAWSFSQEDPLEEDMATHSSILA